MNTVTSGTRNGKVYKIVYFTGEYSSHYELMVYDRTQDQFVKQNGNFNSIQEAEEYLDSHYGKVSV